MLSILIPTYNYNIEALVTELHAQATACGIDFEILCYDDCSTNLDLIASNKSINLLKNTSYKVLKSNIGRSAIRNLLAKDAHYDLLLFLDADVIPVKNDFISKYLSALNSSIQLVYGGLNYQEKIPDENQMLRWVFGKKREALPSKKRKKSIYLRLLSCNFLIQKNVFKRIKFNEDISLDSPEDILFSYTLKENNIIVSHIDNPVYHFGLENSSIFLKKSMRALLASHDLVKNNFINLEYIRIIKVFYKFKKIKLNYFIAYLFPVFKDYFRANLLSKNPSLFIFDLYKLSYLCYKSKKD